MILNSPPSCPYLSSAGIVCVYHAMTQLSSKTMGVHLFPILQWLLIAFEWTPKSQMWPTRPYQGCSTPRAPKDPATLKFFQTLRSRWFLSGPCVRERERLLPPRLLSPLAPPPTQAHFSLVLQSQFNWPVSWKPSLAGNPQRYENPRILVPVICTLHPT